MPLAESYSSFHLPFLSSLCGCTAVSCTLLRSVLLYSGFSQGDPQHNRSAEIYVCFFVYGNLLNQKMFLQCLLKILVC